MIFEVREIGTVRCFASGKQLGSESCKRVEDAHSKERMARCSHFACSLSL